MKKSFDAILFDFDGTLANTENIKDLALKDFFKENNISSVERIHGESSSRIIIKALIQKLGKGEAQKIAKTFEVFQANFMGKHKDLINTPYEDGLDFIKWMKELNTPYTIVTTSNRKVLTTVIQSTKYNKYIDLDLAITKNDIPSGREKPHPDPYILGAKKLNISIGKCLAIEDSKTGIISAIKSGAMVIIVNRNNQDFSEFTNQILKEVSNLNELKSFLLI